MTNRFPMDVISLKPWEPSIRKAKYETYGGTCGKNDKQNQSKIIKLLMRRRSSIQMYKQRRQIIVMYIMFHICTLCYSIHGRLCCSRRTCMDSKFTKDMAHVPDTGVSKTGHHSNHLGTLKLDGQSSSFPFNWLLSWLPYYFGKEQTHVAADSGRNPSTASGSNIDGSILPIQHVVRCFTPDKTK